MTKARSFIIDFVLIVFGVAGLLLALAGFSVGFCLAGRLLSYALICLQAAVGALVMELIMFGALGLISVAAVVAIRTSK